MALLCLALFAKPSIAAPYVGTAAVRTATLEITWTDATRKREVPVLIVYPKTLDKEKPAPVIVFSHGLGATRHSYEGYGEAWASHGYVVIFPQHLGSDASFHDRRFVSPPDRL